ncbi:hypothetical protein L0F63_003908, partial [Massospora cicadina]
MAKLFIGSLAWGTDADSLRDAFCKYGEVTDSFVCRDRDTGRSRGFGFLTFSDEASAQAAIDEMNGYELDGRSIKVDHATNRSSDNSGGGYGSGRSRDDAVVMKAVVE